VPYDFQESRDSLHNVIGNTVILGLGASRLPVHHPRAWLQALTAVLFFFLGSLFTSRVGRVLGPLKRGTLAASFTLQTGLIVLAAALVQTAVVPGLRPEGLVTGNGSENLLQLVPLAALAWQAGMQSVTARELGLNEIPTTVLTSVYCDLGNDPQLFAPAKDNWKRNRRIASVTLILAGAITGGWMSRTEVGMAAGLWTSAGIKASLVIAWLSWAADGPRGESGENA
jgi:uncharacterized membrane protein YoaK (UPF0700 family)